MGFSTCKEENNETTVAQIPFLLSTQHHNIQFFSQV
jgi:hypothetical protein